jgi:hypothetical protein
MAQLIRFTDGLLVEIADNPDRATPVSGRAAERMTEAFQSAVDTMAGALRSIVSSSRQALRDTHATEVELEFGVGFSMEGNVFVTKVSGDGNLTVRVKLNNQDEQGKS